MAYVGDVRRFKSAKALAAFIGVTPRLKESGTSVNGRSMMSRTGHAAARSALYMPGVMAMKHNPAMRTMRERLLASGLAKCSWFSQRLNSARGRFICGYKITHGAALAPVIRGF